MHDDNRLSTSSTTTTRRQIISGAGAAFGFLALGSLHGWAADDDGLTHSSEAIHQEPVFQAPRQRVYQALTDARQFDQIVRLSVGMQSPTGKDKPTELKAQEGAAFTLFEGYIVGRQIELVPNQRIVQAWRDAGWKPGVYSTVRFELVDQGEQTKIVLDHRGFPDGAGPHLAIGWKQHYWGPLAKFLAQK
jgi:uncharacterized protein YndB with AHSA1/START domain